MTQKIVYGLVAKSHPDFIFYVGTTSDADRRLAQHIRASRNPNHPEYNTDKYRFIRELESEQVQCQWEMQILSTELEVDEEHDEYSWILRVAKENKENDILFYDGKPLTNMKAGDFVSEMLADKNFQNYSPRSVRDWIETRKRAISYERETAQPSRIQGLVDSMNQKAAEMREEDKAMKIKKLKRQIKESQEILRVRDSNFHEQQIIDAMRELAFLENDLFE